MYKKILFTGCLTLLITFCFGLKTTHANFCTPGGFSHYKSVYCEIQRGEDLGGGNANEEVIRTISEQFGLEEDLINQILDGKVCKNITKMTAEEKAEVPEKIITACLPEKVTINQQLLAQNLLTDVQNAFQKERVMLFNKMALKMKFEASEQYWDGKIGVLDAPFDLMLDLNLIDIVLFGSKAKWNEDVYNFPEKEGDEKNPEEVPLEEIEEEGGKDKEKAEEEPPVVCVQPDDPEADPNAIPNNPFCGNGNVDLLLGEKCDDGNKESGDGCNQLCQTENNGANNICQDPDVITFKEPISETNPENACPPGSVPKKKGEDGNKEVAQLDEYPGPSIGGTLKQFPESARPVCGPGKSPVEITIAGKKEVALDGNGDPRCLPTEFCSDPDVARSFFAATSFPFPVGGVAAAEWKQLPENNPIRQYLESIEAMACVNVIKENRPTSYYNPNEGCVDCHIRAMVDALEKALDTNVTPLANPTKAFGLSSRFGPNMSFNLITTLKPKLKFTETNTAAKAIDEANKAIEKAKQEANKPKPAIEDPRPNTSQVETEAALDKETQDKIKASLESYNLSGGAISDTELTTRVGSMLTQMQGSFDSMQSKYVEIVNSTALNDTPQCK